MGPGVNIRQNKVRGIELQILASIALKVYIFCKMRWFLLVFLIAGIHLSVHGQSSQTSIDNSDTKKQDTFGIQLPTFRTLTFSFQSQEEALDSLLSALLKKKGSPVQAFLPKALFTVQWKLHDTAASQQIIDGAWMGYQYQFTKSFQKTRKYLSKNKIGLKRSEISLKPTKITEDIEGSGIRKYEYTVTYKKIKYIFWFQLWWINDKASWVNDVGFRLKSN